MALAQKGMDPLGAALAGPVPAGAPAMGLADSSDRDRSHVWELAGRLKVYRAIPPAPGLRFVLLFQQLPRLPER